MEATTEPLIADSGDDAQVTAYRSLSLLALCAFFLGLLSALALTNVMLWILPLAAIVVGLFAYFRVSGRSDQLYGRPWATAGLLLGVFFGLLAPTRALVYDYLLFRQGKARADEWLELIRSGAHLEAYELHLPPRQRRGAQEDLAAIYEKSSDARKAESEFWSHEPLKSLLAAGANAQPVLVRYVQVTPDDESERNRFVILDYEYRLADDSKGRARSLRLFMRRRTESGDPRAHWEVFSVVDPTLVVKGG